MNIVYDALINLVPGGRRRSSSGWVGMNGVCCVHNGETPDTRKRMSISMGSRDDAVLVSCFNCKFRAIWKPGQMLGKKMTAFLGWMGMSEQEIKKLNFKAWQTKELVRMDPNWQPREVANLVFKPASLPENSRPIKDLIEEGCQDPNFIKVLLYLDGRGDEVMSSYDFHWTPCRENDLHQRVTIPFRWNGEIVGWTARAAFPTKNRYHSEVQPHYLFNTDVLGDDWEFLFLCEGPLDAIAINGVSPLGDKLTEEQIKWLNRCGKKVVVVPDQENNGGTLVDVAAREGWHVSFPRWENGIKDAADAVNRYGKLHTVWSIIDARVQNKLEINVRRQRLRT
jgi:hypothetical protein